MTISIRLVQTDTEAEAVFRLRYGVYVEELGRVQRYADHAARMIREPMDQTAHLWAAFDGPRVVGSLRHNYARNTCLGEYLSVYGLASLGELLPQTSITTKLVIAPEYRNASLACQLAEAAYRTGLNDGIDYDFIDVYPARVPLFERLGYRVHVPEAFHSEFGRVIVMKLAARDAEHLRRTNSPFLRYLQAMQTAA